MSRSSRTPGRAFRISVCCTCEDNESEPATVPASAPAGPRPGQTTRLTPRTELGLGGLGGPVARLPPGLQFREGGSRRRSRALTQTGISEATLVAGSQPSDIELNETQPPADHVTPTERRESIRTSVVELPSSSPVERDPGPSLLISPMQDSPTQGMHQDSLAPSPGYHRMQDETHQRRRRSLYVESSPRLHDTRQHRRRSLVMDNLPTQQSRVEGPSRARGPEDRSASGETRQRRRRSSQIDSSRLLESPVTRLEGRNDTPQETRQSRRRSLHIDSSPHQPDLRQHRRRSYLQNPPRLSQPREGSDIGRLAHLPLGVEQLFPESPSPEETKDGEGGVGNADKGKGDVKRGESSKDGAEGGGSA